MILRRHKKQLQDQNDLAKRIHGFSENDLSKYRKSVLAILYVFGVKVSSYMPCIISFTSANFFDEGVSWEVTFVSAIVVLWNSTFNPLFFGELQKFDGLQSRNCDAYLESAVYRTMLCTLNQSTSH